MFSNILLDPLLSFLYPAQCAVCGQIVDRYVNGVCCSACWTNAKFFNGSECLCFKCGAYLSPDPSPHKTFCHSCDSYHFDRAVAVGLYDGALSATVLSLKSDPHFPKKAEVAYLERFKNSGLPKPDIIVPVPLSRKRRFERGFNQATVLGNSLGKYLNVRVGESILERVVHTNIHRVGMDKKGRELSVKKAFKCNADFNDFEKILLVDDVLTSGATASACALELKKNGASTVNVFTITRAALKFV